MKSNKMSVSKKIKHPVILMVSIDDTVEKLTVVSIDPVFHTILAQNNRYHVDIDIHEGIMYVVDTEVAPAELIDTSTKGIESPIESFRCGKNTIVCQH